jgi:hypothetical protein
MLHFPGPTERGEPSTTDGPHSACYFFPAIAALSLFPSVPPLCCELDIPQDMAKSSDLAAKVKSPTGRCSNRDQLTT